MEKFTGDKDEHLLDIRQLKKHFPIKGAMFRKTREWVQAVDGISLFIDKGETLGLVGESGCGKSTIGKCVLNLFEPNEGKIFFSGKDIFKLKPTEKKNYRKKVQTIFQDPYSSLNPRMTAGEIVIEPLRVHSIYSTSGGKDYVQDLFKKVGLSPEQMLLYPHEFSGGQRQRIGIARALALHPQLIVCDEPVSALDVSIQAQVINLLDDLKDEFNLSYLFIAHDLSVIEHISDKIAVMYLGKIVEIAKDTELYSNPQHPYTKALLSAVPIPDPKQKKRRVILQGEVPSPISPPSGCKFHPRCPEAKDLCSQLDPEMRLTASNHYVACFNAS